jgi:hypothetical protein
VVDGKSDLHEVGKLVDALKFLLNSTMKIARGET